MHAPGPVRDDGEGDLLGEPPRRVYGGVRAGVGHRLHGVGGEEVADAQGLEHRRIPDARRIPSDVGYDVGPGSPDVDQQREDLVLTGAEVNHDAAAHPVVEQHPRLPDGSEGVPSEHPTITVVSDGDGDRSARSRQVVGEVKAHGLLTEGGPHEGPRAVGAEGSG